MGPVVSAVPVEVRGSRCPGTGVKGSCELLVWVLEAKLRRLQEHLRGLSSPALVFGILWWNFFILVYIKSQQMALYFIKNESIISRILYFFYIGGT